MSILKPESEGRQVEWNIADLPFVECDPVLIKQGEESLQKLVQDVADGITEKVMATLRRKQSSDGS